MKTITSSTNKAIRMSVLSAFALLALLAFGGSSAQAQKSAVKGKLTDVGGAFICDCTNSEGSCYCLN